MGGSIAKGRSKNRPGGPPGTIDPIAEYANLTEGRSVIGGYVYRGSKLAQLSGKYVFGDFAGPGFSGARIFEMDFPSGPIHEPLVDPNGQPLAGLLHGIGEDADGELYLLMRSGDVLQLTAIPLPPAACMGLAALGGLGGLRRLRQYVATARAVRRPAG